MHPKHEIFCQEYLYDCNAAAAAKRAGYLETNAADQGCDLLKREDVQDRIHLLMEERAKKASINSQFVLDEILAIAKSAQGTEKLRALELLGKHLHLFNEKLDVNLTLARQAEEYAKLPKEKQIELMESELARLKGAANGT